MSEEVYREQRLDMVRDQIEQRGVTDPNVLHAMRTVPRHLFVPSKLVGKAYRDRPLPIGHGQTISQPYIVAAMTEALGVGPGDRVLEVGTGCGYQAAVLAEVVSEVVTVEVVPELASDAATRLKDLSYRNIEVHQADGVLGFPAQAPYAGILVACGAVKVPPALLEQLAPGRRLIIPVGKAGRVMKLQMWESRGPNKRPRSKTLMKVRFVPLVTNHPDI